nr:putative ankyrin repeat protein RF_0381 isoform X2 [Crassostrea gigas]
MCLPNENLTELLEFCYIYPRILIENDLCLILIKRYSRVDDYNCSNFSYGCPDSTYFSSEIFKYPSCSQIENGCFLADSTCKSSSTFYPSKTTSHIPEENMQSNSITTTYLQETIVYMEETTIYRNKTTVLLEIQNEQSKERFAWALFPAFLGLLVPVCVCFFFKNKIKKYRRNIYLEIHDEENLIPLYERQHDGTGFNKDEFSYRDIFEEWQQEDKCFVPTKASEQVENKTKDQLLVTVAGKSGSGKSAIIHHIALKYREMGWAVTPLMSIKYFFMVWPKINKTLVVINDPIGKESFNKLLYNSWQRCEEMLTSNLKEVKFLMTCRKNVLCHSRVKGIISDKSNIVDIDCDQYKLTDDEKRQILNRYTSNMNLSEKECAEIIETEDYFPLLCRLYSSKNKCQIKGVRFFREPSICLIEEISGYRQTIKEKYCALFLLTLFNNGLCINDLPVNDLSANKFKRALKLCGMDKNTSPEAIENNLESLKGFLVRKIGDTYHFYHDLVLEVVFDIFGRHFLAEIIEYSDIGFLRRILPLNGDKERKDPFTMNMDDKHLNTLGKRFFAEIFKDQFLEVVLNPWLKNKKVMKLLITELKNHPEKLPLLLKEVFHIDKQNSLQINLRTSMLSELAFLSLRYKISPLCALIVCGHTNLSLHFLKALKKMNTVFVGQFLFPAVCYNGSTTLFDMFLKEHFNKYLMEKWDVFYPIHIASMFHNTEVLTKMLQFDVDLNLQTKIESSWTPLSLAIVNETQKVDEFNQGNSSKTLCISTIDLLLKKGADINLSCNYGNTALNISCCNGQDSIAQFLLDHGADINLGDIEGYSPLHNAAQNGHDSTVKLLLKNGADFNSYNKYGFNPLYIAIQRGHDRVVQLLLNRGADVNLCSKYGDTSLSIASSNKHCSTVQLLLDQGANVNSFCNGTVPLAKACKKGHYEIVQLLLHKGANINICGEDGVSPLYIACENGHKIIVQFLLETGATINLCKNNGASPLLIACQNGQESTVEHLLKNGAYVNLCMNDRVSPLYVACQNEYDNIVQILLENGANINVCKTNGTSPLYKACQNGKDSTVQILLNHGADINLCDENGISPFYVACQNGLVNTVKLLLMNKADIDCCNKDGASALYKACQNGHDRTVQFLLQNGADINLCDTNGLSPLHKATQNNNRYISQLLTSSGAKINLQSNYGDTALNISCSNGQGSIAKFLLDHGADINLGDIEGCSPLYNAAQNGHGSMVDFLLDNGADVNLYSHYGFGPLYVAIQKGHDRVVQVLLTHGADINLCSKYGDTPLIVACYNGHDSIVQMLLSNGAKINMPGKNGRSPLLIACQNGHDSIVLHLLKNKADINLCDQNGCCPLYKACQNGHESTVQILLRKEANVNLCMNNDESPINIAYRNGYHRIVHTLLENGANISFAIK